MTAPADDAGTETGGVDQRGDRTGPSGVVTVLFTDIEGSTPLWQRHPEAMARAVAMQQQLLSERMRSHGGVVFTNTGDGLGVVFIRPDDAVAAASAAQRDLADTVWPSETPLRVRIGMHTGFAERSDDNYFGPTVNTAARVADAGHGDQIVLSGATQALLHDAADVHPLGAHSLRGLDSPVEFFQVGTAEFAPLRAKETTRTSLPPVTTPIIGRQELVGRVRGLLVDHQLVTLLGTGGAGKTRLALEVAHEAHTSHSGTYFVPLGSVVDPGDIESAIVAELGLHVAAGAETGEVIASFFSEGQPLVVLDNCEHVLDAVADLIDDLADAGRTWRVIATSREALDIEGEQLVPVSPLDASAPDSAAVELFCERARAVRPDFTLDPSTTPWVVTLCQTLDGLPLAIELAAARVGIVSVEELCDMLDDRFAVLRGGRRRRSKGQTLEATVAWSYDLLESEAQRFFRALGVFDSEFDRQAAAAVAGVDPVTALDTLAALASKSLLVVSHGEDGTTYRLLETLRAYAEARLDDHDEHDGLRDAHLDHLLDRVAPVVDRFMPTIESMISGGLLSGELARARDWAVARDRHDDATRLTIASTEINGIMAKGRILPEDDRIRPSAPTSRLRSRLVAAHMIRHNFDCNFHLAYDMADRLSTSDDAVTAAFGEALAAYYETDRARTRTATARARAVALPADDPDRVAIETAVVFAESVTHLARGDVEAAHDVGRRWLEALTPPDSHASAVVVSQVASTAIVLGRPDEALRWLDSVDHCERVAMISLPSVRAIALAELGRVDEARVVADRFSNRVGGANAPLTSRTAVGAYAAIAIARGDHATAQRLLEQPTTGRSIAHYLLTAHLLCRIDPSQDLLSLYRRRLRADNAAQARGT